MTPANANSTPLPAALTPVPLEPIPGASKALRDGDYATAAQQYTAATANAATRCDALYGVGVASLRMNAPQAAEDALTQALTTCPPTFRAYVQRGEARRTLNRGVDAVGDYQQALNLKPGLLDSYLYERMIAAGAQDPTLQPRLVDAPRYLAGQFALRNQYAAALLATANPAGALAQYEQILSAASKPAYRAEVEVNAAAAEVAAGKTPAAYTRLNRVLSQYPDTPAALSALQLLVKDNQHVDVLLRARINVKNGNYQPVVDQLKDYLPNAEKPPAELWVLYGIAQRQTLPDPATAIATLQSVRDRYPTDPQSSIAALEQGRTYFNAKDYLNAVNTYIGVVNAYPATPEAPEALWRAAYLTQTYIDAARSVLIYQLLVSRYPESERAKQGAFDAAQLLAATDPKGAAALFAAAKDARGLLWSGKMLQRAGDANGARAAWTTAAGMEPNSFWGERAADLLANVAPYQTTGIVNLIANTEADRMTAEMWLRIVFKLPSASLALSAELAADRMLTRGSELFALGWLKEARAELDALHEAKKEDAQAMAQLAVYFNGIGAYRNSANAALRTIYLYKFSYQTVPAYLLRLAYPIPFTDLVLQEAKTYNVDPLFYAALIRLESAWEPNAQSGSDARGLTQVIPLTAGDIYGRLKWPTDFTADDLYKPYVSLRYGAYYIDFTRRYLGGNLAATLAGYNAGPGASKGWLTKAGDDIDQFYEIITSSEAQTYVQITYENFTMYRFLYGK